MPDFSVKNASRFSLLVLVLVIASQFSVLTFNPVSEEDGNISLPAKWQDWVSGRSAEDIHADSIEKVIVLLAKTNDASPEESHDVNYFEELLFGDDFGSMAHYYLENSRGQTKVEGEVIGWLQLSNDISDYDEDLWKGEEYGVGEGIEEALALADSSIDYGIYDQDSDGYIDNLMVIFVGENDAANGDGDGDGEDSDSNAIWPIQWQLQSAYSTDDEVSASKFFVCSEYCGMGTFAHEFGHNLGLPDLYDSDYSSEGVGFWSVMGGGNYLEWNDQVNPAHFGAWSKYKLGWVSPIVIEPASISQQIILDPVEINGNIIKVPISNLEYWLIEYRSINAGEYDRGLPNSGVLIWHIDEGVTDEYGDFDNSNEEHPAVKLIQSDDNDDLLNGWNDGDAGDLFQVNSIFNNRSTPSALAWSGMDVGLSLSISELDEASDSATISFSGENQPQAWFYEINWEWQDTEGDGFMNQIAFNYDIDSDSSDVDVRVEYEIYSADTHDYRGSTNTTHTIFGDDVDEFEYATGWYSEVMDLIEVVVLLWVGDELVDLYVPEHPIWLEYPSSSNQYDEWFNSLELYFIDSDGDGNNETVSAEYEVASDDPDSPLVEVWLKCFNQNDIDSSALVLQENLVSNNNSLGTIEMDISSYDIQPGMIDIWVYLWVGDELEEVFAWPDTEFWWNELYIVKDAVWPIDTDDDGKYDSISIDFQFDNSWRANESIDLEFLMWNLSDVHETGSVPQEQVSHTLFVGPRSHSSSGGRDAMEFVLTSQYDTFVTIELKISNPDGTEESIWYPEAEGFHLWPIDTDGGGDNSDEFPNNPDKTKDTDGDGIGDNYDQCPDTALNTTVDLDGCAIPTKSTSDSVSSSSSNTGTIIWGAIIAFFVAIIVVVIKVRSGSKGNEEEDVPQQQFMQQPVQEVVVDPHQLPVQQTTYPHSGVLANSGISDGHEWLKHDEQIYYRETGSSNEWTKYRG